jgi:molybdopterin/thiamine biosynthesis adenylyltransferase
MAAILDADAWDRQRRIKGWSQPAVAASNCLVIGAGALGNEVCKLLLQLGVNKLTVVDYDTVEQANLNRCVFFSAQDALKHELKAKVIAREGVRINPTAAISFKTDRIEDLPESFYSQFDYAFGCLDNLGARLHANSHCYGKCPYIDGGTTGFLGRVQTVSSPSPCFECALTSRDYKLLWKKYSCLGEVLDFVEPAMPALATTTSLVASVMANEFVKLSHKQGQKDGKFVLPEGDLVGKYWYFNGLTNQSQILAVPRRLSCPVH